MARSQAQNDIMAQHRAETQTSLGGMGGQGQDALSQIAQAIGSLLTELGGAIVNDPNIMKGWLRGQFEIGEIVRGLPTSNSYKGDLGLMTAGAGNMGVYGAEGQAAGGVHGPQQQQSAQGHGGTSWIQRAEMPGQQQEHQHQLGQEM